VRGARVAALVVASFLAVVLFLFSVVPDMGGVCAQGTACTGLSLGGVVEVALLGLACAGIGLLAGWRKP
jgi:hypothetical protein